MCSHQPAPATHSVVRMARRPVGNIQPGVDLVLYNEATPTNIGPNQVLVHRLYLSLDPAMRSWMRDMRSYIPPVKVNDIMRGHAISEVVFSRSSEFKVGDIVETVEHGWAEYALVNASDATKLQVVPKQPISLYLGILGFTGMTAYFGLIDVGKPKPGDVVLVSGAAGATGSVVCQIAKILGCRVIGIAGGEEKCKWLVDEIGCVAAIDYKKAHSNSKQFQKLLRDCLKQNDASDGVDIFFDNVGGMILNETLRRLKMHARVVICGAIASYNEEDPRAVEPPTNYMSVLTFRARMEGFVVFDYLQHFEKARNDIMKWVQQGKLNYKEDIRSGGLAVAPQALLDLYSGGNTGKLIVKIGDRTTVSKL